MFWLTGSQKFNMMQGVSESPAGRVAVFTLSGFSAAELEGRPAGIFSPALPALKTRLESHRPTPIDQLYQRLFRGSMPELCTTDLDRDRFYMDYISTYIPRDVNELAQVGKLNEFYDLLVFWAARTGQELKYDEIANAVGISAPRPRPGEPSWSSRV